MHDRNFSNESHRKQTTCIMHLGRNMYQQTCLIECLDFEIDPLTGQNIEFSKPCTAEKYCLSEQSDEKDTDFERSNFPFLVEQTF